MPEVSSPTCASTIRTPSVGFLGIEAPRAVAALGGKFAIPDAREIPDTLQITWNCGHCLLVFTQVNANTSPGNIAGAEMMFRDTKGTLYATLNGWEIVPERITRLAIPARTPLDRETERGYHPSRQPAIESRIREGRVSNAPQARNFLDCVKSRSQCQCNVLPGHRSTAATLISNIALETRRLLEWDAEAERFPHDPAANQLLHDSYRLPYKLG